MNKIDVFIIGAGGHTKVLLDCLRANQNITVLGILDINPALVNKQVLGVSVIGDEDDILKNFPPSSVQLVNGIGSIGSTKQRENIFRKFQNLNYHFINIIHKTAYVGSEVILNEGVQLMAGSIIQPGCHIGRNVIINTHASVDHDCFIDDHVHIAPNVTCCGEVVIGKGSHVGSGAIIRQGIHIGEYCMIASGAVVVKDVVAGSRIAGVPARLMES